MADDSPEIVKEQVESSASNNVATIANGPGFFTNHLFNLANNSAAGYAATGQAISGKIAESIIHTSPSEGASAAMMTALLIKNAQSTAPLTGGQLVPGQGE